MAGVAGKSGRKSKAEEMGLVALLDKCFSKRRRTACLKKLAEDAESDEFHIRHEARKLLLAYTFGKPVEKQQQVGERVLRIVNDSGLGRDNDNAAVATSETSDD